jgi:NTP pyrophosphatase (non-canonical NTP hydrolase)
MSEEREKEIAEIIDNFHDRISNVINKNSLNEYQKLCKLTAKKFETPEKEILTWGLGIAGEAGDVASCIKKTFAHDNDQRAGIRENIGDSLWYAAMICNFFNWDMQEILEENIKKLKVRYPNGFTIEDAKRGGNRVDWNNQ